MKRMWILPGIYNSSMTQISLKSAVQNSIWHTASARAPGHASLEGINGTLGQLGHFDARNHLLETTWLLHMIHLTLNMNYCVILKESHKKHRKMKCRDSKWFAANETKLEMHLWRARKKKKNLSSVEGPLFNFHAMQNICQILSDGCEKLLFQR